MWVARNKNGTLWLYRQKPYRLIEDDNGPYREQTLWETDDNDVDFECALEPKLFPDLKWEDEPIEVNICDVTLVEKYEELKDSYDALHMTYLSQVSLYKSLYEEEKKKNLGNVGSKE